MDRDNHPLLLQLVFDLLTDPAKHPNKVGCPLDSVEGQFEEFCITQVISNIVQRHLYHTLMFDNKNQQLSSNRG